MSCFSDREEGERPRNNELIVRSRGMLSPSWNAPLGVDRRTGLN